MTVQVTERGKNIKQWEFGCGEGVELLEKRLKIILASFKCVGSSVSAE